MRSNTVPVARVRPAADGRAQRQDGVAGRGAGPACQVAAFAAKYVDRVGGDARASSSASAGATACTASGLVPEVRIAVRRRVDHLGRAQHGGSGSCDAAASSAHES